MYFKTDTYSGKKFLLVLDSFERLADKSSVTNGMQITFVSLKQELVMQQFNLSSKDLNFICWRIT